MNAGSSRSGTNWLPIVTGIAILALIVSIGCGLGSCAFLFTLLFLLQCTT